MTPYIIDTGSDEGAWADALRFPCSYRVVTEVQALGPRGLDACASVISVPFHEEGSTDGPC